MLAVGAPAPDFVLKDQNNQEVRLSSYAGRQAVLIVFYPLAFTGTCRGELVGLQASLPDFQNETVQVLTISVDSPYSHKVWADREGFAFPMLADFWPHGAVAAAYGVFNAGAGFANRGTFLVDRPGTIVYAEMRRPGEARELAAWREAVAAL